MINQDKKYDLDRITRGVITIGILVLLYMGVQRLYDVLLPFMVSWLVAYFMNPMVRFFQYKCRFKNRAISIITSILVVLLLLTGFGFLIIPSMINEMVLLSNYVQQYIAHFDASLYLPDALADKYEEAIANLDVMQILSNPEVLEQIKQVAPKLWSVVTGSVNALSGFAVVFICLLYIFFILLDYDELNERWSHLVPVRYRANVRMIVEDVEQNMNIYFRNQAKIASIVGLLFALGFHLIGLPMGIAMGFLIGLMNMVPYLQVAGIPPCILLAIIQGAETGRPIWLCLVLVTVVFCVVQVTHDKVLTPRIMGNATGLIPAVMLLALSIWGSLLGVAGMIIALPMTSVIISYYKRFVIDEKESSTLPG